MPILITHVILLLIIWYLILIATAPGTSLEMLFCPCIAGVWGGGVRPGEHEVCIQAATLIPSCPPGGTSALYYLSISPPVNKKYHGPILVCIACSCLKLCMASYSLLRNQSG